MLAIATSSALCKSLAGCWRRACGATTTSWSDCTTRTSSMCSPVMTSSCPSPRTLCRWRWRWLRSPSRLATYLCTARRQRRRQGTALPARRLQKRQRQVPAAITTPPLGHGPWSLLQCFTHGRSAWPPFRHCYRRLRQPLLLRWQLTRCRWPYLSGWLPPQPALRSRSASFGCCCIGQIGPPPGCSLTQHGSTSSRSCSARLFSSSRASHASTLRLHSVQPSRSLPPPSPSIHCGKLRSRPAL